MSTEPTPGTQEPTAGQDVAEERARAAEEIEQAAERDTVHPAADASLTQRIVAALTGPGLVVTVLAVLLALVTGAILIAVSDTDSRQALSYVFAQPGDFLSAAGEAVSTAYKALLLNPLGSVRGLTNSLLQATPLILAGLAVALPFRAGLFNIGGEGQVVAGGMAAALVGFGVTSLPGPVVMVFALVAGVAAGGVLGFIPAVLKTRTGAHEVISTIMLNNIMLTVLAWSLTTDVMVGVNNNNPQGQPIPGSVRLPPLIPGFRVTWAFVLAIVVAMGVYVLIDRSSRGFEIQAVGMNPRAAATAGMSVDRATITTLTTAGMLAGLAGAGLALSVHAGGITGDFSGGLGFEGITVALLGRSSVGGTVVAGLAFGVLAVGGRGMQGAAQISLDLVGVIQALIIMFVAAPALIRAVFPIGRDKGEEAATMTTGGWG